MSYLFPHYLSIPYPCLQNLSYPHPTQPCPTYRYTYTPSHMPIRLLKKMEPLLETYQQSLKNSKTFCWISVQFFYGDPLCVHHIFEKKRREKRNTNIKFACRGVICLVATDSFFFSNFTPTWISLLFSPPKKKEP